jgi:hypothetical protein
MPDITLHEDIRIDDIHRAVLIVGDHDTEVYISITTELGGFTFSRYMEVAAAEAFVAMIQKGIEAVKANIARGVESKFPRVAPAPAAEETTEF